MNATGLAAFRSQAADARAELRPGTVTINGTGYAGGVLAGKAGRATEDGGWVQIRTLTAQLKITVMALTVVVDTAEASKPVRENLIVTHDGIVYRLKEAHPDATGTTVLIKCEEEHSADE